MQKAAVEPTGISIIPDIELTIGEVYDIVPDIKPADALTSLSWESDNSAVASVENGSITALSEGECNVTVTTSNNLSVVCHVVVKAKVVTPGSIELSEYDVTLTVGESRTLTASVYHYEQAKEALYTNCSGVKDSSGMSGIPDLTTDEGNPYVEVYNLNGVRVFSGEKSQIQQLRNGIYIFRSGNESHKVIVR